MIYQSYCNIFSIENVSFLLGRKTFPMGWDTTVENMLRGKVILITGAGGSIGSHLVEAIMPYGPARIIALDNNEKALFDLKMKTFSQDKKNTPITYFLGDIKDIHTIKQLFFSYHPQMVFHAAAYKHVSFMEMYFYEALKNNVLGTKILADAAVENQVEQFVFISTDKAVNPASIMGVSKRLGELYISGMNKMTDSRTKFTVMRFGNVFHSSGSVINIFLDQLRNGKSLIITDPRAERYFMTINEATGLILKSLCESNHKKAWLYVLKIGELVKIKDLAERLIQVFFQERENRAVDIAFIGLGQGEKLKEQFHYEYEILKVTNHPHIFEVYMPSMKKKNTLLIAQALNQLEENNFSIDALNALVEQMIPEYSPTY